jgi:hypothetical protein
MKSKLEESANLIEFIGRLQETHEREYEIDLLTLEQGQGTALVTIRFTPVYIVPT